jgi:hypothetical protein
MILPNVYAVLNHYNMNTQMKNAVNKKDQAKVLNNDDAPQGHRATAPIVGR